ncbi:hypothetical protein BDR03DRAFT_571255 [Suillus americanus]|nr:hypothetical protein BDR03DRAFT_571255 [Suillus americanus]
MEEVEDEDYDPCRSHCTPPPLDFTLKSRLVSPHLVLHLYLIFLLHLVLLFLNSIFCPMESCTLRRTVLSSLRDPSRISGCTVRE